MFHLIARLSFFNQCNNFPPMVIFRQRHVFDLIYSFTFCQISHLIHAMINIIRLVALFLFFSSSYSFLQFILQFLVFISPLLLFVCIFIMYNIPSYILWTSFKYSCVNNCEIMNLFVLIQFVCSCIRYTYMLSVSVCNAVAYLSFKVTFKYNQL